MYYLLENNQIIDSKNLPYEWKFYTVLLSEKDKIIILHCRDPRERKKYKIKKQSENVCDLIEVGDLVNLDKTLNQVIAILKEDKRTIFEIGDNKWFSFKELNNYLNNNLLAIYKPDANGNYIKVWEEKDDINK